MNKTNKNDKRNQKGRSMVEMLGVLSIIGILSVGGISAYSKAVEKHKANEALHKASMMATTVSAYAMTNNGKLPSSITDFPNSGYTTTLSDNGTQFNLKLSGIGKDVCTQMQNAKGGMVREVVCDESVNATITYYKNLATTEAEGEKSPTGEKPDPACVDVTCEDGLTCFHGECKCSTGLLKCGTQCCAEGTYCAQGADTSTYTCAEPTGDCSSNSDCGEEEYCKFSDGSCTNPGTGTCTDKGELDDTNDFTVKTLNLPGGALTVYKGSGTMNWWSASNLCQAHGKQMVTMSDLGIADSGTNTECYFDKTQSSYARKPCICNDGSDSDCSATNTAIRSRDAFGTPANTLWLADNYTGHSCRARTVALLNSRVFYLNRTLSAYALCR